MLLDAATEGQRLMEAARQCELRVSQASPVMAVAFTVLSPAATSPTAPLVARPSRQAAHGSSGAAAGAALTACGLAAAAGRRQRRAAGNVRKVQEPLGWVESGCDHCTCNLLFYVRITLDLKDSGCSWNTFANVPSAKVVLP